MKIHENILNSPRFENYKNSNLYTNSLNKTDSNNFGI